MHKKKYAIILALCIWFILYSAYPVSAYWKHHDDGRNYASSPSDYDKELHYNAFDWIADGALHILLENDEYRWTWLRQLQNIYFVGTEAIANYELHLNLNGTEVYGYAFQQDFVIKITSVSPFEWLCIKLNAINEIYNMINASMRSQNFWASAYYMGVLSGMLSLFMDFQSYMVNNKPYNYWIITYPNLISGMTANPTNPEQLLAWNAASVSGKTLQSALNEIAGNVVRDTDHSGMYDIDWINQTVPDVSNFIYRYEWASLSPLDINYAFYHRIEELMNYGILRIASVFDFIADSIGFNGITIADPNYNVGNMSGLTIFYVIACISVPSAVAFRYNYRSAARKQKEKMKFNA